MKIPPLPLVTRRRCPCLILFASFSLAYSSATEAQSASSYWGAFVAGADDPSLASAWTSIGNFETDAQKNVSIINFFKSWTYGTSTTPTTAFPTTALTNIRNHGSIPLLTWQPENGSQGTTQSFTLTNIINGTYDSYITTWANGAKAWGNPFFLRFAHEMNGTWYPWSEGYNSNTAGQYVQAWHHVHDIFTQAGVTNVTWVWCVNTIYPGTTDITELYPGDNYVDWIALDSYNGNFNTWADFSTRSDATLRSLISIAPGKPVMVAEAGCNEDGIHDKGQWFRNALTGYVPNSMPRIKAWSYFNSPNTNGNDWRITTSTGALSGYRYGIALPYYGTNQYGSLTGGPIQPLLSDATSTDTMAPFLAITQPTSQYVTAGSNTTVTALASDKSGINHVNFYLNGAFQQTKTSAPYTLNWAVPTTAGRQSYITAKAYDSGGNMITSTVLYLTR
jgi:beta-mannanase